MLGTQFIHNLIINDILSIHLCISKFQTDILYQGILKVVFTSEKTIKHITFKYNLTDWIILNPTFQIKFIKRESSIPNHSTHGICWIHMNMAPKKDKQIFRSIKPTHSKNPYSALFEKFMPLYYDHFEVASSSSHFNHHNPSASLVGI